MSTELSSLSALQQQAASPPSAPDSLDQPQTPKEAATQFEKILVRQFVEVMTKDLFSSSLSGEDGPQWMSSQRDTQRDTMTDVLTNHLVESDTLEIRELLMRRWGLSEESQPDAPASSPLPTGVSQG